VTANQSANNSCVSDGDCVEAERRLVTAPFTDMVGFTTFSLGSGEQAAFTLTRSREAASWRSSARRSTSRPSSRGAQRRYGRACDTATWDLEKA
jgi:hypothetical protein